MKNRVYQLENKNQFIIANETDKGTTNYTFQSYDSIIANFNEGTQELILGYYWDYSKTTSKHLYIFMYQYCNFNDILSVKNKRKYINDLIAKGKIKYCENLK